MKKLIFCSFVFFMLFLFPVAGMSKPEPENIPETIIGYPVYLGNAPFEQLAIKVAQNDGEPEVYLQIEFPEDSKLTENEIATLQGYKVKFFGYTEDKPGGYTNQIFILLGYKK